MANWWEEGSVPANDSPRKASGNWWEEGSSPVNSGPKDTSLSKGLAYGAESAIRGLSATAKYLGGPQRSMADRLADLIHQDTGLDNYSPAGPVVADSTKGVGERLAAAPRALVEGIPGVGSDLVAGAALGPAGFLASNSMRNLGPNAEASKGNTLKALGLTAADAVLARVGAKATIGASAKTAAKAAGIDAAVASGQAALDKGVLTGEAPTAEDIGVNALIGGAVGAGVRGVANLPELRPSSMKDRYFNPVTDQVDPQALGRFSDLLKASRDRGNENDYTGARDIANTQIKAALTDPDLVARLKDEGSHKPVTDMVKEYQKRLDNGERLTDEDIGVLSRMSGSQDVVDAFKARNAANQVKPLYENSLASSPLAKALDPNETGFNPMRATDYHVLWKALNGKTIGPLEAGLGALQVTARAIPRALDKLSGASDPSAVLIDRFAGKTPPPVPADPANSYLAMKAEAAAAAKADALAQKLQGKQEALDAKAQAKAAALAQKDFLGKVGSIPDGFMPQSQRFGRDMGEVAGPEAPQYGASSPVDLRYGVRDEGLISQFDNERGITDPSQIPLNDPMRDVLLKQLERDNAKAAEDEQFNKLMAQERALLAAGIDVNAMALPGVGPRPPKDRTGMFPEPNLLQPPPLQLASPKEKTVSRELLSRAKAAREPEAPTSTRMKPKELSPDLAARVRGEKPPMEAAVGEEIPKHSVEVNGVTIAIPLHKLETTPEQWGERVMQVGVTRKGFTDSAKSMVPQNTHKALDKLAGQWMLDKHLTNARQNLEKFVKDHRLADAVGKKLLDAFDKDTALKKTWVGAKKKKK